MSSRREFDKWTIVSRARRCALRFHRILCDFFHENQFNIFFLESIKSNLLWEQNERKTKGYVDVNEVTTKII